MVPVVVIGELNVDLILGGCRRFPAFGTEVIVDDFAMTLGSASAICTLGLARLSHPVAFHGVVGDDPWGDYCVTTLAAGGVDVSGIVRDGRVKTGVTVSLTANHDRALVTYPGAMTTLTPAALPATIFAGRGHLHVSSFFLQTGMRAGWRDVFAAAHASGWTVSLDPGHDPADEWGRDLVALLPLVDVLFPNEVELAGMTGLRDPEAALRALANGRTLTVAKLGSRGCLAIEPGGDLVSVTPPTVQPVDTTGAGDSFNAGFLHARLAGRSLRDSMRAGAACGALSTLGLGGTTAQPTDAELERCLEGNW